MRTDIQFLRGIAVLFVVLYHSGLGLLPEGYLGVDVFFVISGFLITKVILEGLNNNNFTFANFYYRRAKRLLPALYSTLFFTTIIGVFFLTRVQWTDYLDQLIGALTFTANLVLPGQTGYFEQASEGKPLLHIWSLSLEEQYYFVLPLILFILPKRIRVFGLITLFIISLVWCFNWILSSSQDAPLLWRLNNATKYEWAFYLLPTRAWELLAGSIAAWVMIKSPNLSLPKSLKYVAFTSIMFLGFFKYSNTHPSIEAFIVVICTALLLLGQDNWLPPNLLSKTIQKVGDWSYSIYLVHWPLFSFAHLAYIADVPPVISFLLMVLSILLGFVQFKYIETPFRYLKFNALFNNWKPIVAITLLIASPFLFFKSHPLYKNDYFEKTLLINQGLGEECENSFDEIGAVKPVCMTSLDANVAVWGDSYAMHLVPGLAQNHSIVQLTKSACGPFPNLARINQNYNAQWAKKCIEYNDQVLDYIISNKLITHVIMSSPLSNYLSSSDKVLNGRDITNADIKLLVVSFESAVKKLTASNKIVTFIAPPPKNGKNIGECLERLYGPALLMAEGCSISMEDYLSHQSHVIKALNEFEKIAFVYSLSDHLCVEGTCAVSSNGKFLYRDEGHLSISGSKELFKNFKIEVVNNVQ